MSENIIQFENKPKPGAVRSGTGSRAPVMVSPHRFTHPKEDLLPETLVLTSEDRARFDDLRTRYWEEFQPQGALEQDLVDELVAAKWRQRRVWAIETAAFDHQMDLQELDPDGEGVKLLMEEADESTRTMLAFRAESEFSGFWSQVAKYEMSLHHVFHDTMKALEERRKERPAGPMAA